MSRYRIRLISAYKGWTVEAYSLANYKLVYCVPQAQAIDSSDWLEKPYSLSRQLSKSQIAKTLGWDSSIFLSTSKLAFESAGITDDGNPRQMVLAL